MFTTLISASELQARLGTVIIIDCRFDLGNIEAGQRAYDVGHIPGARYAHLDRDLSGPKTPQTGRHPLPDPTKLCATLGRWGIASNTQVIAYDADTGMFASRLWWLLRWLGHRTVAVLDGGFKAWISAGFPATTEVPTTSAASFTGIPRNEMMVTTSDLSQLIKRTDWRLLDARASERFRGDVEPIDPVAGHIPGARNHPFASNMAGNGRFLSPDELREKFAASLDGVPSDRSVMMCGSGVTACHNILALEVANLSGAKLYAGSWSEWIRDPTRPIAKGAH